MGVREVEALVALPHVFPGSVAGELCHGFEELVVVTSETGVCLPIPDVVKFRMSLHEPLQRHELMPVYLPVGDIRVPTLHDAFIPKNADVLELSRDCLLQEIFANPLIE